MKEMDNVANGHMQEKKKAKVSEPYVDTPNVVRRKLAIKGDEEANETQLETFLSSQSHREHDRHYVWLNSIEYDSGISVK